MPSERASERESERESNEIKKTMAYDLIRILETSPQQESYSVEEIKKLINTYIETATTK